MRRVLTGVVAATAISALVWAPHWSAADTADGTAIVTVDAGADLGKLNNPAWYHNQTGPKSHLSDGELTRVNALAPRVVRLWAKPADYYDVATDTYDLDYETSSGYSVFDYFDQADSHSDQLLVNFDQCDQELMDLASPDQCRKVLRQGLLGYKERYPALRYVEVFNEPDKGWTPAPGEPPSLTVDEYYDWYKIAYSVVNEVNEELKPAVPIELGGPVTVTFNQTYLASFLKLYGADPDSGKRLDFIAYHEYGGKGDPATVASAKSTMVDLLAEAKVDQDIPLFITEYGVFPGSSTGGDDRFDLDLLTQAAAMATLGIFFVSGGVDMPMHWVFNHPTNNVKSMLADDTDGGAYPYYHVVAMQTMLKARRVTTTTTGLTTAGLGVNALGTADGTGVAVLTTNYRWINTSGSRSTTVKINNLPAEFTGRQIRLDRYLVDANTSGTVTAAGTTAPTRVERTVLAAGSVVERTFTLAPNAVSLVVVTPVVHGEAESLTATTSGGTAEPITGASASGGMLSKFYGDGVGSKVSYPLTVDRAGNYELAVRMKAGPDRGVAEVAIDGVKIGGRVDTYDAGGPYLEFDLGARTLAAGKHTISFTIVDSIREDHNLGVDYLQLEPVGALRYEVEDQIPRSPSGDPIFYLSESGASAGRAVKIGTDGVDDSVQFRLTVPRAGRYQLTARVRAFNTRGTCQFRAGGATVGAPVDLYSATVTYPTLTVGTLTAPSAGNLTLTCAVTGHNAASTGYDLSFDYLQLNPTA